MSKISKKREKMQKEVFFAKKCKNQVITMSKKLPLCNIQSTILLHLLLYNAFKRL
jgi:hypothetical protein